MEPMPDATILLEGPFPPEALDILWQPDTSIPPHAQSHIDARWSHYLAQAEAQHKSLFNAPVSRLLHLQLRQQRIQLTLAPTDYKTFLVTTLRDRPWFQQHAPEALRPALGNSAFLTHHHRALLGIRSPRTSAYADRAHLIGGVLEPLNTAALPATPDGILTHLRQELHEELAITAADLSGRPTLLFIVRDEFLAQPELVWHWELATDLETIAARLDPDEHHGHLLLTKDPLTPDAHARMTPLARLAWDRWCGMK
jgi:hypothetical protein